MKRVVFYLIPVLIISLILTSCNQDTENKKYNKEIVNDGEYIKVETENKKFGQYTYPALNQLIESIEDSERRDLVVEILYTPTIVEMNEDSSVGKEKQDLKKMYMDTFKKAEELINLPIKELRKQAEEVSEKFKTINKETKN